MTIGVNDDGYREVIGAAEGFAESAECWREFLSWLKSRGLRGVRMFAGNKAAGMVGSIAEVFPDAAYQRCTVHFYGNVLAKVPKSKRPRVAAMLKAVHAMESREASEAKALEVADELEKSTAEAAKVVRDAYAETLASRGSRGGTGAAYAPTTPSRGSTARFADGPAWSAPDGGPKDCRKVRKNLDGTNGNARSTRHHKW